MDLALTDLDKAIPEIQRVLRQGNVPKRSWILFFDAVYENEWVGIYEDTPEPPR